MVHLDRRKNAGESDEVARAHADRPNRALRDPLATKAGVQAVDARQEVKFDRMEKHIDALDAKLDPTVARLDAKIDAIAARLQTKVAVARVTTTRWRIGTLLALGGLSRAMVKYSRR